MGTAATLAKENAELKSRIVELEAATQPNQSEN
jgi:hypothetical protein